MTSAEEHALTSPGEHPVDVPITCAITRFGVRSPRLLASSYLDYRRMAEAARQTRPDGLLRSAFLIERPTAWYSLSIWSGTPAFSAQVPDHVDVARRMFGRLAYDPERGPELWTTKWRLTSVTNNLNWDDFDLRRVILEHAA